jgi:hypothetical protein
MTKTAKTSRNLSKQQITYVAARVVFDAAYSASREYDKVMDTECERLGIETPYGILPEGHAMWAKAQQLLDKENETKTAMYKAAHDLFDWATSETFKRCGTTQQHKEITDAVNQVKKMAFVEKHFEELVDMSLRLAA